MSKGTADDEVVGAKASKTVSRYRKVEVRTWGDEKFRALSPIPPCGQGLWLFLITGPHTGPIPGLFRAGRAAMAEELGWELEAFDEAFGEAFRQGMVKADFKARVVWVPKSIRHNRPESPNVVRSWAAEFDLIPECDLKREAFESLKASIHGLGEAFGKAFDESFVKPSGKPSAKPSPKAMANQEQEQEQEQEKSNSLLTQARARPPAEPPPQLALVDPPPAKPKPKGPPDCPHAEILALWAEVLPAMPQHLPDQWRGTRAEHLRARWRETAATKGWTDKAQGLAFFRKLFAYVGQSPFLTGKVPPREPGKRPFVVELEWLVSPGKWAKVIEGKYHEEVAA